MSLRISSSIRTWKDRECPNCQEPREWWEAGAEGEGHWRCPTCEPEAFPKGWLRREISIAADETHDWPAWMQAPELWHPTLGRDR